MSTNPIAPKPNRTPLFIMGGLCGCLVLLGLLAVAGIGAYWALGSNSQAAAPATEQAKQLPTIAPTNAPAAQSTAASTALPLPGNQPTAAPVAQATLPPIACGNNPVCSAIAKTRAETKISYSQLLRWDAALTKGSPDLPADQLVDDEIQVDVAGQDQHAEFKGPSAALFAGRGSTSFSFTQVGGKTYVLGPAASLQAPENRWYQVTDTGGVTLRVEPFALLDQWAVITNGWQGYAKQKNPVTYGDQTCDDYINEDSAVANQIYATVLNSKFPADKVPVVERAFGEVYVCSDGYAHMVGFGSFAHWRTKPDQKGTVVFLMDYSDFGTASVGTPIVFPTVPPNPFAATATVPGAKSAPPQNLKGADAVRAFFAAVNARDLDTALQFTDDLVILQVGKTINQQGRPFLRSYFQSQIDAGAVYTISNLDDLGGANFYISFDLKVSNNPALRSGSATMNMSGNAIADLQLQ